MEEETTKFKNIKSILSPGTSQKFDSPLSKNLIRTGTLTEGSCFFHSLMTALSSNYRKAKDEETKERYAVKMREKLANKITKETWENFDVEIRIIPFLEKLRELLEELYEYFSNLSDNLDVTSAVQKILDKTIFKECREIYELILQVIPWDKMDEEIIGKATNKCYKKEREFGEEFTFDMCRDAILKTFKESFKSYLNKKADNLDSERKKFFRDKFKTLIGEVVKEAEDITFREFKENLLDCGVWADPRLIGFAGDVYKTDVYFIDSETRMPYILGEDWCNKHIKGRKSIVILWLKTWNEEDNRWEGMHYESVARLDPQTKVAKREFKPDDPLIKTMRTVLCHPEKVKKDYPELLPYLPNLYA